MKPDVKNGGAAITPVQHRFGVEIINARSKRQMSHFAPNPGEYFSPFFFFFSESSWPFSQITEELLVGVTQCSWIGFSNYRELCATICWTAAG